jgi:1-acyl-sn-glycerol-3-phosphate acyltransferase
VHPLVHKLSRTIFHGLGWRITGEIPPLNKFVIIGGPHTSNWDFMYMLLAFGTLNIRVGWMAKDVLFKPPLGWLMRRLGGISINRSISNNVVDQVAEAFQRNEKLIIGLLPEGTRSKRDHWKSGFYYMALTAQVPIVVCSMDYLKKVGDVGFVLHPSGNIEADIAQIRDYMVGVVGKNPEKTSLVRVKPRPQSKDTP